MKREKEIYAKQEQIRLIDMILASLCTVELSNDGRVLLKKMKKRLSLEIIMLKNAKLNTIQANLNENSFAISTA